MERVSTLCLSLLLCSLSGAELQDNEMTEHGKVSPESVNVPEPQASPSDLHALLLDLSAKLAVLQFRVDQLQTLSQEQAAKLKEVDTHQQEQAANLKGLETQVDTQQQVGQVAFSASLLASGSGFTGPFNAHTTLVFKHVVSNIGNAYSPKTGFFIAPVRGAYHFEFYVHAQGGSHGSGGVLMKNGEHIFEAYEHQTNGWGAAANGATLLLEAGDVVFLRLAQNHRIFDNQNRHSTFSGHLLFPM